MSDINKNNENENKIDVVITNDIEQLINLDKENKDVVCKENKHIEGSSDEGIKEVSSEVWLEELEDEELEEVESDININNKKESNSIKVGAIVLISSIVSAGVTMFTMNKMIPLNTSVGTIQISEDDSKQSGQLNVYQAVAKKASPSVVGIMTTSINSNNIFSIPLENSGVGTGVIVDSKGYILTNAHVVSSTGDAKISVVLNDGKSIEGKVLWQDESLDLAVVKIDGSGYIPAELGDSDNVTVGDISVAIGNPIGLEFQTTVTQGIISGINRSVEASNFTMEGLLQTDASINPGNSGGPLLNSKGQVIGINTAKTSNAEGIGFAIPINVAKPIVEQVIKTGTFDKVILGIKGMSLSAFESLVGADLEAEEGVYIVEVQDKTPAKKAGIKTGDVIEGINGEPVTDMNKLTKELYKFKDGDSCIITINRSGEKVKLEVKFKKNNIEN